MILYSSINPTVHLIDPNKKKIIPLDFSNSPLISDEINESSFYFGIWSIKFSGDGSEVIAGCTSGGLCMYFAEIL